MAKTQRILLIYSHDELIHDCVICIGLNLWVPDWVQQVQKCVAIWSEITFMADYVTLDTKESVITNY